MFTVKAANLRMLSKLSVLKIRMPFYPIFILGVLGLACYPFINGYGCDFSFKTDNDRFQVLGECKDGILTYATFFKKTKKISVRKDIFGVVGNKVITVKMDRDILSHPSYNLLDIDEMYREYKFTSDVFRFYRWGIASKTKQSQKWFFLQKVNVNDMSSQIFYFDVSPSSRLAFVELE